LRLALAAAAIYTGGTMPNIPRSSGCGHGFPRVVLTVLAFGMIVSGVVSPRSMLGAQTPSRAPAVAGRAAQPESATVVVLRRPIVVFRASLGALSPADRAAAATRRLEALIESEVADTVAWRPLPEGVLVTVGGRGVFTITRADVDTLVDPNLDVTAEKAAANLRTALAAAREEVSLPHFFRALGLALLGTLAFLLVLRGLRIARRFALSRLPDASKQLSDLAVGGFTLLSTETLLLVVRRAVEFVVWAARLFLAYLWLAFVLTRFAYTRPWGEALGGYLGSTVARLALVALGGIPGLFTVALIFIAARWLVRIVSTFFNAVEAGSVDVEWVHPETANPTKRIIAALVWLFAIVIAYPYLPGSGSDVFKGVTVFAGLVLSLGSSGIVSQAMSGLVLMYARALRPGDYVRVGDTEGTVTELGMLATKIRTTKHEEVTLPNAIVVAATIKNFTRTGGEASLFVYTSVTIGYDTPWRQVQGLLLLAAERTQGIRAEPAPFVLKTALSDFYIEYQLNVAAADPRERIRLLDRLHAAVIDAFNEFGVQITSPHYMNDLPRPAVVPREHWFDAPAQGSE
jgi:small-conductance mechanosensitive channel